MKKVANKLSVQREIVRTLSQLQFTEVVAGDWAKGAYSQPAAGCRPLNVELSPQTK